MSKELTAALHELMQQNDANIVPSPKPRGAAPASKASALLPGSQSSGSAAALEIGPAKVLVSSDGLFAFSFPATATTTDSGTTYTLGVVETSP